MAGSVEEWLGAYLNEKGWRIATAESCTGGLIAGRITDVSGSSAYFEQGFITYSNEAKMRLLDVSKDIVATEGGPGSGERSLRARDGGRRTRSGGERSRTVRHGASPVPRAARAEKPVGTVYMAVATPSGAVCRHHLFEGSRLEVKAQAAQAALEMARDALEAPGRRTGA